MLPKNSHVSFIRDKVMLDDEQRNLSGDCIRIDENVYEWFSEHKKYYIRIRSIGDEPAPEWRERDLVEYLEFIYLAMEKMKGEKNENIE